MTNPFWWAYNNPEAAITNVGWVLILVVPLILITVWSFTSLAAWLNTQYKNRRNNWHADVFPPLLWVLGLSVECIIIGIWVLIFQFLVLLFI